MAQHRTDRPGPLWLAAVVVGLPLYLAVQWSPTLAIATTLVGATIAACVLVTVDKHPTFGGDR